MMLAAMTLRSPRRRRIAPLLVLLTLAPLAFTPACKKNGAASKSPELDPVDRLSLELLDALTDGDRDALAKLASATLEADLGDRDLASIARTLLWLGPVELEQRGEEAVAGGVRRSYLAHFERGDVELDVVAVNGEVEGFEFEAAAWETLVERAAEVEAGSLRVAEFVFQGPEGQDLPAPTDPAHIDYALAIEGLEIQLREHHVLINKVVVDAGGNEVYRQRQGDDIRFPQAEAGSSGGRITGNFAVPGPGSYTLKLQITDLAAGDTIDHEVAFEIP